MPLGQPLPAAVAGTLPAVAALSERIVEREGQYWLQSSPAAAAIQVNGSACMERPLRHMDVITVTDGTDLVFLASGVIRLPTTQVQCSLEWLDGPTGGLIQTLAPGEITFGRGSEATVRIDHQGISRVHARLMVEADRVTLEDLQSPNGTSVNGRRITGTVALHDGDEFELATVQKFKIRVAHVREHRSTEAVRAPDAPQPVAAASDGRDQTRYMPPPEAADLAPPAFTEFAAALAVERGAASVQTPPADGTVMAPMDAATPPAEGTVFAVIDAPMPPGDGTVFAPMDAAVPPAFDDVRADAGRNVAPVANGTMFSDRGAFDEPPPQLTEKSIPGASASQPSSNSAATPGARARAHAKRGTPSPIRRVAGVRLSGSAGVFTARLGRTVVGRSHDAGIRIDVRQLSRAHAALSVSATGAAVDDLGSANGTMVNGRTITGSCPLTDGDRLTFGELEFTVNIVDEGNA